MKKSSSFLILIFTMFAACGPSALSPTPIPITVQYTPASAPWVRLIFNCNGTEVVNAEQRAADYQDQQSIDLAIRIGQPAQLSLPSYQIGSEDIIIVTNPQNPVKSLSGSQVRGLFSGQIMNWDVVGGTKAEVMVWVYSPDEDIQQIMDEKVLQGSMVAPTARLAADPEEMVQAIANDANAVGVLTRSLKNGDVENVYNVLTVPVLAVSKFGKTDAVQNLLACLQK
jgi:ABC-type phosphate transport system substrate-binding protein